MKIPFNKPSLLGNEFRYISDAIHRGHLSGDGYYSKQCSDFLQKTLGVPKVLMISSCTHALELAFMVLDIHPKDEIILPSFTFPSTANAFVLRGGIPRFVDIRPDTFNMNEHLVESAITPRTRAIAPVHYAGVCCEIDEILKIAKKNKLAVIEDAAQALGGRFRSQAVGSFGDMNAFSFHETKNCICGEGGALVIKKSRDILKAEIIRQKGTNRQQFLRGQVAKYSWVSPGSSYLPSELQTAYLYAQLEHLKVINRKRQQIYERYRDELGDLGRRGNIQLPFIPAHVESSYHLFHTIFNSESECIRVQKGLNTRGILAIPHYVPLHLSRMGRFYGYRKGDLPVTESIAPRLLRLPMYNTMRWKEQKKVIDTLKALI